MSKLDGLTKEELQYLYNNLDTLTNSQLRALDKETEAAEEVINRENCQENFMDFVHKVWPNFIDGEHHQEMAAAFEKVANGKCKRLIINMPPRHTKSEFASYLLPAWFLGKFPKKKIIETAHTAELAVGFGRKVRNLVDSDVYKSIFPGVGLQSDSKAAGRWATNQGGDYFAIGVGGAVTGKGADILIIDDPHSEQEAALSESNPEVYDKTYEWYTSGPRQRLQPGGSIIIVMTRWSKKDLTGQVVKSALQRSGEQWEVIEFLRYCQMACRYGPSSGSLKSYKRLSKNCLMASGWLSICSSQLRMLALLLNESGGRSGTTKIRPCVSL